ncbi:hypothetical protein ABPH35_05920 [Streptococcus sp. ZJ93]|uniref:hypothetical protein n=1 Tax=Streptococcus handemini TaxID=3161188 RepID=UPI0032EB320D
MKLWFEMKKIFSSSIYWFFVFLSIGLMLSPIFHREKNENDYVSAYTIELENIGTVLTNLKIDEQSEEQVLKAGILSDVETLKHALKEKTFDRIPRHRTQMYQDLERLVGKYEGTFRQFGSLTKEEVRHKKVWNDWLVKYSLADEPEQKGWSTGRMLQKSVEQLFSFGGICLVGIFFLIFQSFDRREAYQRWQLVQVDSCSSQEIRRILASVFLSTVVLAISGLSMVGHGLVKGYCQWSTFLEPVELVGQGKLIPLWLYLLCLCTIWFIIVIGLRLIVAILTYTFRQDIVFLACASFLVFFLAGASEGASGFSTILSAPVFLHQADLRTVFLQLDGLALIELLSFIFFYLFADKRRLKLSMSQQQQFETPDLSHSWSFEWLQYRRTPSLSYWGMGILLLAVLFSIMTTFQKNQVVKEERESLELVATFSKREQFINREIDAKIDQYRQLIQADDSYKNDLDKLVTTRKMQEKEQEFFNRIYQAYYQNQKKLPSIYRDYLQFVQKTLLKGEETAFYEGDVGATRTLENLRRYQSRYEMSSYYWEQVEKAGAPVSRRGKEIIIEDLENRFATNDANFPVEDVAWGVSRDFSGVGTLRTFVDGPFYLCIMMLAVWLGSRGKAVEVEGKTWFFHCTQPVSLRGVLLQKWWQGLLIACVTTVLFSMIIFVVQSIVHGIGAWQDGIIAMSHQEQGLFLHFLKEENIWVQFVPNLHYLCWMFLGIIGLEIVLVSVNHLMQAFLSNRILVFLLVSTGLVVVDIVLFRDFVFNGIDIFRKFYFWR